MAEASEWQNEPDKESSPEEAIEKQYEQRTAENEAKFFRAVTQEDLNEYYRVKREISKERRERLNYECIKQFLEAHKAK